MKNNLYIDTETCGLHGIIVLIQCALDDGEIELYNVWQNKVKDILDFLRWISSKNIIAFNLVYDWFHLYKLYTLLKCLPDQNYHLDEYLEDPYLLMDCEERAIDHEICLKPAGAFDLMLHARKGPYQTLMDRKKVVIKKIPTPLAQNLANEMERRLRFNDIYFARRKTKNLPQWQVMDIKNPAGEIIHPEFKNIVVNFKPSGALKTLAVDALGLEKVLLYDDSGVDPKYNPTELGYAPYCNAILDLKEWPKSKLPQNWHLPLRGVWPELLPRHTAHWYYNEMAREYATDDVTYTRDLYKFFEEPIINDDDSQLAVSVACSRWRAFELDLDKVRRLKEDAIQLRTKVPIAGKRVREYLMEALSGDDLIVFESLGGSTKKTTLEHISKWVQEDGSKHPAAIRAGDILLGRQAKKRIETYDKYLIAKRLFASLKIIGALTGRMSGADDLNPQGIPKIDIIREAHTFAKKGYQLDGGDFESFEVIIYLAVCNDPELMDLVFTQRKKVHAVFGSFMFPDLGYEGVLATEKTQDDKYKRSKSGLFALIYGGDAHTLVDRVGISQLQAEIGFSEFLKRFPAIYHDRKKLLNTYSAITQPDGIGSAIFWKDPQEYVESLLGFRRYFTLEYQVMKALFEIAQKPPKDWKDFKMRVQRHDRVQSASGATQSALYGSAFAIQSRILRIAGNHRIQATGAQITKKVQRNIWDLQPVGEHTWLVQPLNEHDELPTVTHPSISDRVKEVVEDTVKEFGKVIPGLRINWKQNCASWKDV